MHYNVCVEGRQDSGPNFFGNYSFNTKTHFISEILYEPITIQLKSTYISVLVRFYGANFYPGATHGHVSYNLKCG
jgi:hypothetical protein